MSAKQRRYFGGGRRRRSSRRRQTVVVASNPRRRRRHRYHAKRHRRRSTIVVASNPRRRRRYSFRRNPVDRISDGLMGGAVGAVGALGVSWLMGNIPLPQQIQQGTMLYPLVKIGAAIGLGYAAGALLGKRYGAEVMTGAIAVTVYQFAANQLSGTIQLGRPRRFGRYIRMRGLGRQRLHRLGRQRLHRYIRMKRLGWISPARLTGPLMMDRRAF